MIDSTFLKAHRTAVGLRKGEIGCGRPGDTFLNVIILAAIVIFFNVYESRPYSPKQQPEMGWPNQQIEPEATRNANFTHKNSDFIKRKQYVGKKIRGT